MAIKRFLDGLRYNRKERQGLLFLAIVLSAATYWVYVGGHSTLSPEQRSSAFDMAKRKLDSVNAFLDSLRSSRFFLFDPNAADSLVLDSLGLNPVVSARWQNFIDKGGFFKSDSDVLRIYGLDSNWWAAARPYMLFGTVDTQADTQEVAQSEAAYFRFSPDTMKPADWMRLGLTVAQANAVTNYLEKSKGNIDSQDLGNIYVLDKEFLQRIAPYVVYRQSADADSLRSQMIPVNLIDAPALSVLTDWPLWKAEKLINYRDKLGGFHASFQIWETFGLDSNDLLPFQGRWDLQNISLHRIDINQASIEELSAHPYIDFKTAKAIVDFREEVRPFRNLEELQRMRLMSERKMAKLAPYLLFVY